MRPRAGNPLSNVCFKGIAQAVNGGAKKQGDVKEPVVIDAKNGVKRRKKGIRLEDMTAHPFDGEDHPNKDGQ